MILISLLIIQFLHASEIYFVNSPKAVVYSDINLKKAIGMVKKGRKLAVEKTLEGNQVAQIMVSGKPGYLAISDLSKNPIPLPGPLFPKKVREHEVRSQEPVDIENFSKNNYAAFSIGQFSLSSSSYEDHSTSEEIDVDNPESSVRYFTLEFLHRDPHRKWAYQIGLNYAITTNNPDDDTYVRWISLNAGATRYLFKNESVGVGIGGDIEFSMDAKASSSSSGLTTTDTGFVYGSQFFALLSLFPASPYGLSLGGGVKFIRFSGLSQTIHLGSSSREYELSSQNGAFLFARFEYRLSAE